MTDALLAREIPNDPPRTTVPFGNGHASVVIDGDVRAPAVVFIHGIPGSARDGRYLGPALARHGLCCIRMEMPGFGETPTAIMPSPDAAQRGRFVVAVLEALSIQRFAVAAHSGGCVVALAIAAEFPLRTRALCMLNGVGVTRHAGLLMPPKVHTLMAHVVRSPFGAALLPRAEQLYRRYGNVGEPVTQRLLSHHLLQVGDIDFVVQRQRARAVQCPTLLLSVADDRIVEPRVAIEMQRALTQAPLVTHVHLRHGGHHGQKAGARPVAAWLSTTLQQADA